jgi:hypothetical protein
VRVLHGSQSVPAPVTPAGSPTAGELYRDLGRLWIVVGFDFAPRYRAYVSRGISPGGGGTYRQRERGDRILPIVERQKERGAERKRYFIDPALRNEVETVCSTVLNRLSHSDSLGWALATSEV